MKGAKVWKDKMEYARMMMRQTRRILKEEG